jgi:hypothetical protein
MILNIFDQFKLNKMKMVLMLLSLLIFLRTNTAMEFEFIELNDKVLSTVNGHVITINNKRSYITLLLDSTVESFKEALISPGRRLYRFGYNYRLPMNRNVRSLSDSFIIFKNKNMIKLKITTTNAEEAPYLLSKLKENSLTCNYRQSYSLYLEKMRVEKSIDGNLS